MVGADHEEPLATPRLGVANDGRCLHGEQEGIDHPAQVFGIAH